MAGTIVLDAITDGTGNTVSGSTVVKGSAKAWVNFNGTTATVRSSFNISSVVRNGAGLYTINMTTAMPNATYAVNATSDAQATGFLAVFNSGVTQTTSAFGVSTYYITPSLADSVTIMVSVFSS
jgi:hypothetical protein